MDMIMDMTMGMIFDERMTPLMKAAKKGDTEEIRKLVKAREDANAKSDEYGMTALMYAAGNCRIEAAHRHIPGKKTKQLEVGERHTEAIKILRREAEADVNARDNYKRTALMWAVAHRYAAIGATKELLEVRNGVKADIDAKDEDDRTALMYAAYHGSTGAIRELLNAGADVNAKDRNGRTAFDWWQTKQGSQGYSETFFQEISDLLLHASVSAIVKEELKSTRVSKVNIREDESSYDSEPLYRIEIIFEGKRLNPDNVNKMLLRVRDCLLDIDDERFPLITFVSDTGKRKAS
ncbi:MAG: ankyrin repeat domain-containing protein [Candidatus Dadabacteria bacterium]|nr:ankyrin repeat domain-containing protein [Candidatus Dadabacteria bacterium]